MPTRVAAHITGTVLKISKRVGEAVSAGETVLVLESMKMEMPVEAPELGYVCAIEVKEGQSVCEGEVLAVLDSMACQ